MSSNVIPTDFKSTMAYAQKLFDISGLPLVDANKLISRNVRFVSISCILLPIIIIQFLYFFMRLNSDTNFLHFANNVACFSMYFQDIIKILVLFTQRKKIRLLVSEIKEMWPSDFDDQLKRCIFLRSIRKMMIFNKIYYIYAITGYSAFIMAPLIFILYKNITLDPIHEYLLPLDLSYPFEIDSISIYLMVYLQQLGTSAMLYCIYIACDIFIVSLAGQLSTLLRLLQLDLGSCVDVNKEDGDYGRIRTAVQNHQKLLRLVDSLNDIFGVLFLLQVTIASISICFFGFQSVYLTGGEALQSYTAAVGMMYNIYFTSWPGQILYDTSSGVAEAAYNSRWYERDVKYRKYMIIIICRAQKPCRLSALGYTDMTLDTFSTILKTSWSYLSLLKSIYER